MDVADQAKASEATEVMPVRTERTTHVARPRIRMSLSLVHHGAATGTERPLKSGGRVRDLGEVFTPAETVQAMLDLFPPTVWAVHPAPTFLEPSCGDGNFLVAILTRKLAQVAVAYAEGRLPAGTDLAAVRFHTLEALSSIYAVDISVDNVIGGTPGHEVGARERLIALLARWYINLTGTELRDESQFVKSLWWVVEHNIQIGNMLAVGPDGSRSGRDTLPIIEFEWKASTGRVNLRRTTLGDVAKGASQDLMLFGPTPPAQVWEGVAVSLWKAVSPVTHGHNTIVPLRNGKASR